MREIINGCRAALNEECRGAFVFLCRYPVVLFALRINVEVAPYAHFRR